MKERIQILADCAHRAMQANPDKAEWFSGYRKACADMLTFIERGATHDHEQDEGPHPSRRKSPGYKHQSPPAACDS